MPLQLIDFNDQKHDLINYLQIQEKGKKKNKLNFTEQISSQ